MKFILSVVVMVCVWEVAFTQGPRTCGKCHELEEEIGRSMKGRIPLIGINQLNNLCPKLKHPETIQYCEFVVDQWERVLKREEQRKKKLSVIEKIFNHFNWFYIPRAIADYKTLCQLVEICYF